MSIITAFEELSLTPFCSDKIKEDFSDNLPCAVSKINFLSGDQLSLRMSLSLKGCTKFADAVDVVVF
jgi:hypothetical protein